jgi:hypothetical protein
MTSRMTSRLSRWCITIALVPGLVRCASPAHAQLTGMTVQGSDAAGNLLSFRDWDTVPTTVSGAWKVWVVPGTNQGAPFLNGPGGTQAGISVPLSPGTYSYYLYTNHNFLFPPTASEPAAYGLNLFFNGSSTPSISVFAPTSFNTASPGYAANPPTSLARYLFGTGPAAGTVCTVVGNNHVVVSDFQYFASSVYGRDRVAPITTTPDGLGDNVGRVTLRVTSPPVHAPNLVVRPLVGKWITADFNLPFIWALTDLFTISNNGCEPAYNVHLNGVVLGPVGLAGSIGGMFPVPQPSGVNLWLTVNQAQQYPLGEGPTIGPGASSLPDIYFHKIGISDSVHPIPSGTVMPLTITGTYYTQPPDPILGFLGKQGSSFSTTIRVTVP